MGWLLRLAVALASLPVSNLERAEPVSFSKEILPLLQRSCLACHHAKEPEGHLILESHTLLLKGGETGPGIIAGKSAESLLFARATGQVEPLMPPEDNKVGAKSLSADELGLLKRWIDEGAKADAPIAAPKLVWQALPETYRPVYAIALSPDDQYAVYGQGNRAKILHLPTWTNVGQLIDPSLNSGSISGLAHLDIVQSVAFSPDGSRIATGGYKSAKIWKRVLTSEKLTGSPVTSATSAVSMSLDGSRYALVAGENIELWDRLTNQKQIAIKHELPEVSKLQWSADNQWIAAQGNDGRVRVWQIDTQQLVADQAALPLLQSMLLSATGKWLVGINPELKLSVWTFDVHADMPTPMMLTEKKHEPWQAFVGINALAVLPMDAPRIVFASEDGKAMIADPTSGAIDRTIDHGSPIKSLTISQDRLRLATGAVNGTIKVWAIASGEQQLFLERDALTNLAMAAATGNVNRQTANIQRLTNKVGELEKAITKETEAITKAEETRKKAEEEVAVKAKEVEAAKKLMTDHEQRC